MSLFNLHFQSSVVKINFVILLILNLIFVCLLLLFSNSHSDSADQNATRTSRRSATQEKQDGPKHSERHLERNWQWWDIDSIKSVDWQLVCFSVTYSKYVVFQDNSLEFEKRRNIPVKYKRALWDKTGKLIYELLPTYIRGNNSSHIISGFQTNSRNSECVRYDFLENV